MSWIAANFGTIFVCAVVLAMVFFAARSLVKDKKEGKSPCGCSCSGCAGCNSRHSAAPARGEK